MADEANTGGVGTYVDLLDELEAEGAAAGASAAAAEPEAPAVEEDPTICRRGPCVYFADVQIPIGIDVRPGFITAQQRCFCRAGVEFGERRADPRVASIIGSTPILPIDCSMWSPMTEEELDERDHRRLQAQERHRSQLEAQAALAAAQAGTQAEDEKEKP